MGEVMKLMQGKAGEEVSLVLYRPSIERHITVVVERAEMKNETVLSEIVEVEGVKSAISRLRYSLKIRSSNGLKLLQS